MASIRKRGNSYLLVVSMGYTPDGTAAQSAAENGQAAHRSYAKADGKVVTGAGDAVRDELQEAESGH